MDLASCSEPVASPRTLDALPPDLQHRIITALCADDAAHLGCTSRRWRGRSAYHPLLAAPCTPETAQERVMTLTRANQPAGLARFLVGHNAQERHGILNERDANGLTPLMYMATLQRPAGGGIALACVMIGMGAQADRTCGNWSMENQYDHRRPSPNDGGYRAAEFAAMAHNVKLAVWLEQASAWSTMRRPATLAAAVQAAVPYLVRVTAQGGDRDIRLLQQVFSREYSAHDAVHIIETWRALLQRFPHWRDGVRFDKEVYELAGAAARHATPLPLLRFLHEQGLLAMAMRHADILEIGWLGGVKSDIILYLIREVGAPVSDALYAHGIVHEALRRQAGRAVIACLLERGAGVGAADRNGKSVLATAVRRGDMELYRLFERYGAVFNAGDEPLRDVVYAAEMAGFNTNPAIFAALAGEVLRTWPCTRAHVRQALKDLKESKSRTKKSELVVLALLHEELKAAF